MMIKIARLLLSLTVIVILAILVFAFFIERKQDTAKTTPSLKTQSLALMKKKGVPPKLSRIYYQASQKTGVDWRLLAAIGYAETDHGNSPLPGVKSGINSAGCCAGVMQICVSDDCGNVWSDYRRDGNRNGKSSPYETSDSILTAAYYLRWIRDFVGDSPQKIAAGYNAGPTLVANQGIPDYPETRAYLQKVKRIYNSLQKDPWQKIP